MSTMEQNSRYQSRLDAMKSALPSRSLTLKNAGDGGLLTQIFYALIGLLIFGLTTSVILDSVKEIAQDRKIAANSVVVDNAHVEGTCKGGKIPFLKSCHVQIHHDGKTVEHEFSFLGLGGGDETVQVLAQKDDMSNININIAVEKMLNRMLTLVVWAIIGLVGLWWGLSTLKAIPHKQRVTKIFNDPANQPWELVALPVKWEFEHLGYTTVIDGKTQEVELMCEGKHPLFLDDTNSHVVAIKAKNAQSVVPLMQELSNIDLSKPEKEALLAAYRVG